ncbi:zf-HC2 domain-containing protein [Streptomyces sp. B1866]|uniref:zf-HC2 domain-containing protein n=1 Tax=Streptomyces sp. B1866 TaxID=3075431 RepID=UPI00288FAC2C|nr:zf-HC2 domain-containing protein [Streptomyces sp. B1866]MDT3400404.1 zf-HC2 domain-containing protein [Streptomyces sp. B1866]
MRCADVRIAVSARVDGEAGPPAVADAAVDAHLRECGECRRWGERARELRRLAAALDEEG